MSDKWGAIGDNRDIATGRVAMPEGWYPDPAAPENVRWWDGSAWTPHAMPAAPPNYGHAGPTPLRLDEEHTAGQRARSALQVGVGLYAAIAILQAVTIGAMFSSISRSTASSFGTSADPMGGMTATILVASLFSQIVSIGTMIVGVMFVIWFHRAMVNAQALGLPLRRDPMWAILGFIIPIVNLWFPYQSMCDLFPPGHPGRQRAGQWWTLYLVAGFSTMFAMIGAIFSMVLGVIFAFGTGVLYWYAARAARDLIDQAATVHEELATHTPWMTFDPRQLH